MENDAEIRLFFFVGLFIIFALLERISPKITPAQYKGRWLTNLTITVINTLVLRLLAVGLPLLAIGAALDAHHMGWGVFNQLNWLVGVEIVLAVLLFDFLIWAQHLLTHKIPVLWRLHRVHHADVTLDVTTAVRFHPIEIALSMGLKIGAVYVLGPSALAILVFEILLNGTALFNHANIALPAWLDRLLRHIIVTPDMHRIHHSDQRKYHDSNYGFALSIWDRLFGTYRHERDIHTPITVGLEWQNEKPKTLGWSLWLPFMRK